MNPNRDLTIATSAQVSYLTQYEGTVATLTRAAIGELVTPTGAIIACDPLGELRDSAFEAQFPLGSYPVIICVAELPNGMRISAYAAVEFTGEKPILWEVAHLKNSLDAGMPDRYFTDSGTGCFMDQEALRPLASKIISGDPEDDFRGRLVQQIYSEPDEQSGIGVGVLNLQLSATPRLNCIMFESGWGDDWYRSYLGRDESGAICCLLTDFDVLDC